MTATLAASAAVLKTHYPKGELPKELYDNQVLLAMVKKTTDFDGQNEVIAVQTEGTQGASADFSTAIGSLQQSQFYRFTVTRVSDYSIARIKRREALKAAKNKRRARSSTFGRTRWESASFTRRPPHSASRYSAMASGTRGIIGTKPSGHGCHFTLATVSDITNFSLNQYLQAANPTGPALRAGGAKAQITAIDRVLGKISRRSARTGDLAHFRHRDERLARARRRPQRRHHGAGGLGAGWHRARNSLRLES